MADESLGRNHTLTVVNDTDGTAGSENGKFTGIILASSLRGVVVDLESQTEVLVRGLIMQPDT